VPPRGDDEGRQNQAEPDEEPGAISFEDNVEGQYQAHTEAHETEEEPCHPWRRGLRLRLGRRLVLELLALRLALWHRSE
jgi:hypothetical protein